MGSVVCMLKSVPSTSYYAGCISLCPVFFSLKAFPPLLADLDAAFSYSIYCSISYALMFAFESMVILGLL